MKFIVLIALSISCFASSAYSKENSDLYRRLVVFPVLAEAQYKKESDEAWWKMRKTLTRGKRFLVASRNFLMRKDAFQGRSNLSPADAIILSKLLDAHVVLTTHLDNRKLTMRAYEGVNGQLVWEQAISVSPSLPVKEQLVGSSEKLVLDFVSSLPYQGYVVKDKLRGEVVFKRDGLILFEFEVGEDSQLQVGDEVQVIKMDRTGLKPLLMDGHKLQVQTVARVHSISGTKVIARIERTTGFKEITEQSLVRVPTEMKRISNLYSIRKGIRVGQSGAQLAPGMLDLTEEEKERKPLITALSFIANLAGFILIAF